MSLENIPRELRERKQFVVWKFLQREGAPKPTKPPFNAATGWPASVTDPSTWATFDEAAAKANTPNGVAWEGIGYVIAKDDPYTFIDLDTHDPKLDESDIARHHAIAAAFKGYAEISPSGKGLHLIVKGKVPTGRRRAGVEMYSAERYMTLTGNVLPNRSTEIVAQQDLLDILYKELANGEPEKLDGPIAGATAQTDTDDAICQRAADAINGEHFVALYKGAWQTKYQSQSEADFALIDILSFYSRNPDQIKRIFRASSLGKRDKANRDAYVDPMIAKSFDNQPPLVNLEALKHSLDEKIEDLRREDNRAALIVDEQADAVYTLPRGLMGEIARYIYNAAPRPVKEIALTAAIGLMAGICGRAYNISGTGLNHYVLLLAPTGSGKEAIASGISELMAAVAIKVPSAIDFFGPTDIRSDIALIKYLGKKAPSFVSIVGEFGHTMAQMAAQSNNTNMKGIKRVILDLYGKSGAGQNYMPSIYSDAEKNTQVLSSPAFSLIGESAPEPFYESVDERLVSDGLLPRFTLIEYRGVRPLLNRNRLGPSAELVQNVANLCAQALRLNKGGTAVNVAYTPEAEAFLDAFENHCTDQINSPGAREVIRHIWNRAHLRALKLAASIAVGANPFHPIIELADAQWSVRISMHNTQSLLDRFEAGEVGNQSSDDRHAKEVERVVREFYTKKWDYISKYTNRKNLYDARIVPYDYLQRRLDKMAAFKNDKRGSKLALKIAIESCCDSGLIVKLDGKTLWEKYAYSGAAWYLAPGQAG